MNLNFETYWELLALHKSLMAVKFDENACLPEAQGSPFTASIAFKVFDLLIMQCLEEGKKDQADGWLSWQKADSSRIETELLKKKISKSDWWSNAEATQKEKYIKDFMAPLILTEEVFHELTQYS